MPSVAEQHLREPKPPDQLMTFEQPLSLESYAPASPACYEETQMPSLGQFHPGWVG